MIYRFIILTCIQALQHERSVSAVYYLMQGKQSIQSIQDANLFELHHYYGIYKHLSKEAFMLEIQTLLKTTYIQTGKQDNFYQLTKKGEQWIRNNAATYHDVYFNGMAYRQIDDDYYARLLLMIQVWTNSMKKERYYIPIVDDDEIVNWVKSFYQQTKSVIPTYLSALYNELYQLLESIHKPFVEIFLLQLSSYKHTGLSTIQLAHLYESRIEDIYLITTSMIHCILTEVLSKQDQFPVLCHFGQHLTQPLILTSSATRTNEMLQQGWSKEAIAQYRRLKINTIHDHIVEIAIQQNDFPVESFVTNEQHKSITAAINQTKSYTLKEIKSLVDKSISYFQIRLVLARWNKMNG